MLFWLGNLLCYTSLITPARSGSIVHKQVAITKLNFFLSLSKPQSSVCTACLWPLDQGFSTLVLTFEPHNSSLQLLCPVYCRKFSSNPPSTHSMATAHTVSPPPKLWGPRMPPEVAKCPLGQGENNPCLRTSALDQRKFPHQWLSLSSWSSQCGKLLGFIWWKWEIGRQGRMRPFSGERWLPSYRAEFSLPV